MFAPNGRQASAMRGARLFLSDLIGNSDAASTNPSASKGRFEVVAVAKHKSMFLSEKNAAGELIDYAAAVSGSLRLVPNDEALPLSLDYASDDRRRSAEPWKPGPNKPAEQHTPPSN